MPSGESLSTFETFQFVLKHLETVYHDNLKGTVYQNMNTLSSFTGPQSIKIKKCISQGHKSSLRTASLSTRPKQKSNYLCIPDGSPCSSRIRRCGRQCAWCWSCFPPFLAACCLEMCRSDDRCCEVRRRCTRSHSWAQCWNWEKTSIGSKHRSIDFFLHNLLVLKD